MKSVYACSKLDGTLALAIDIVAIEDVKVIGALLKLAGENGLVIDRVDRSEVIFQDPILIRSEREKKNREQPEIDFSKPAAGDTGPASMGEGFTCTFSGPCPTEGKPCSTCEYASNGIPKIETPAEFVTEPVTGNITVGTGEGEALPTLADDFQASEFNQWACENKAEVAAEPDREDEPFEPTAAASEEETF